VTNSDSTKQLSAYFHHRLQFLDQCNAEIQDKISHDMRDLCQKIDGGECGKTDPAVAEIVFHLEYVVGNTLRYTMLVGVCSFLEEAMKEITKRIVHNYKSRIRARNDENNGNWLDKHIRLLVACASLNKESIQSDIDIFQDLIKLRNCIVHSWGRIAEGKDSKAVKAAAGRLETAEITKDGYLLLGDQVIPVAIIVAGNIAEHLLTTTLQTSMT
jgi:hypothetical protein